MATTQSPQSVRRQGRLLLATQAVQKNKLLSQRKAATLYDAPKTSLRRRLQNIPTIQEFNTQKRKLKSSEEEALVR